MSERTVDPLSQDGVAYYGYARVALVQGMRLMGYEPGDAILFPEYICREVTDYVTEAGFEVRYYRIHRDLSADIPHIRSQLSPRTKAILAVHYFGFPQPLSDIQRVCRKHGVCLIEDNAHGFLGSSGGNPLGVTGDIGILSMRKTLFTPDGAALIVNAAELKAREFEGPRIDEPPRIVCWYWGLEAVLKAFAVRVPGAGRLVRAAKRVVRRVGQAFPNPTPAKAQAGEFGHSISARSWSLLRRADFQDIARRRRANYQRLREWLWDVAACQAVFPNLPDGICPQAFPILVEDGASVIAALRSRGIRADYWPDLPEEVYSNRGAYDTANDLRDHLVTLPIHQDLQVVARSPTVVCGEGFYERVAAAYAGSR